ncbi:hypothetical protein EV210_107158 [Anaerospora hongkongensis]|uniref:Uncharacterized protein n=1 Tax=Anaerospora hongkongensis TaxID=244830 RepID=A0A4R1PWV3_9FIRM|nr:hypothetical protein [Anaerospora hongkongensis]TCL36894.1 hypothetical protein EV210_107158 [Anaerospora hongkongensis]
MSRNVVKYAFLVCLLLLINLWGVSAGQCSNFTTDITEETLWISLDVSPQQKKQIDAIIAESYSQVKKFHKKQGSNDIYDFNNLFILLQYTSKMNDIRKSTSDRIMQVLDTKQKLEFEKQLQQVNDASYKSTVLMLSLDLTDTQKKLVVTSLLKTQKKIWEILSRKSSSWEEKRKKLNRINKLQIVSAKLSKEQRTRMAQWNIMFSSDTY